MEMKRRFPDEIIESDRFFYLTFWGGRDYEQDIWFVNNSDETLGSGPIDFRQTAY